MKKLFLFIFLSLVGVFANTTYCQEDTTATASAKIYVIKTQDGGVFIGPILSQDSREVLIKTKDRGEVSIPKYQIKEMRELEVGELNASGELKINPLFATRYFITTNGFALNKGDSYLQTNLFGPEFHYGMSKNFGVGVMTSWLGIPIIGNAKYSFKLSEDVNFGIGTLLGTGSWAAPDFVLAVPFGSLTIGNKRSNINFSGGYGVVGFAGDFSGTTLLSIGAMKRLSNKITFILDSFIVPEGDFAGTIALIIPGLRFQTAEHKAFQFGLAGIAANGQIAPLPIPMVTWFKQL